MYNVDSYDNRVDKTNTNLFYFNVQLLARKTNTPKMFQCNSVFK